MARDARSRSEVPSQAVATGTLRVNGLLAIFLLVFLGMGVTAGYFHWKAPQAKAAFEDSLAREPTTAEGRLERWLDFGGPLLHSRLKQLRLSSQQPWLVTHQVLGEDGAAPEVWGIDLTEVSPEMITRDVLNVRVRLPRPRLLLRAHLVGDNAQRVPVYGSDQEAPDPEERVQFLVSWMIQDTAKALEHDIPGARILIEIEQT